MTIVRIKTIDELTFSVLSKDAIINAKERLICMVHGDKIGELSKNHIKLTVDCEYYNVREVSIEIFDFKVTKLARQLYKGYKQRRTDYEQTNPIISTS